jgi:hypothetical protein
MVVDREHQFGFLEASKEKASEFGLESTCPHYSHADTLLDPRFLERIGMNFFHTLQEPGEYVVTWPGTPFQVTFPLFP